MPGDRSKARAFTRVCSHVERGLDPPTATSAIFREPARELHAKCPTIVLETDPLRPVCTRDLYVILSGTVEVLADGQTLATLGPGEFFGELAAIDWERASHARGRLP